MRKGRVILNKYSRIQATMAKILDQQVDLQGKGWGAWYSDEGGGVDMDIAGVGIRSYSWEDVTDWSNPWYGYERVAFGGETISNWEASKLGRLSYESVDACEYRSPNPFCGGDPTRSGERWGGGDGAVDDRLGRLVPLNVPCD